MPLGDQFQQLASLVQGDLERMRNRHLARIDRHDEVHFDAAHGVMTYRLRGMTLWQARAELLGRYNLELGLFGWWWHGGIARRASTAPKDGHETGSLDRVLGEGERLGVAELTSSCIPMRDPQDALLLCEMAAFLAQAQGLASRPEGIDIGYYALFEVAEQSAPLGLIQPRQASAADAGRYSIAAPAPDVAHSRPNSRPLRSLPPLEGEEPPTVSDDVPLPPRVPDIASVTAHVRRPTRDVFMPVAQLAMAAANNAFDGEYTQLLIVVSVDMFGGKARFVVNVAALETSGDLASVETTRDLFDAVGRMITEDARSGNGRWRKLVARLRKSPRGASVDVDVQ